MKAAGADPLEALPKQLLLPFVVLPDYERARFHASASNAAALGMIEAWPRWPDRLLLLVGPAGSGKTHLAHVYAACSAARFVDGKDILGMAPADLARAPALIIDDADMLINPLCEAALFHLVNLVREGRGYLLLTSKTTPGNWGINTQDLLSRLRLAPCIELAPPDEALLRAALVKMLADRQMVVEASLVDAMAFQLDRSMHAVRTMVEMLDAMSMQNSQPITRGLVKQVLKHFQRAEDDLFGRNVVLE